MDIKKKNTNILYASHVNRLKCFFTGDLDAHRKNIKSTNIYLFEISYSINEWILKMYFRDIATFDKNHFIAKKSITFNIKLDLDTNKTYNIYIILSGEAEHEININPIQKISLLRRYNPKLTDKGISHAQNIGIKLKQLMHINGHTKIDYLFSSPMARTIDTLDHIYTVMIHTIDTVYEVKITSSTTQKLYSKKT